MYEQRVSDDNGREWIATSFTRTVLENLRTAARELHRACDTLPEVTNSDGGQAPFDRLVEQAEEMSASL